MMTSRILAVAVIVMLSVGAVDAETFRTKDPLRAFVRQEYPLGSDYFIRGNEDTYIFRCPLTRGLHRFEGIALSEISIWGRTRPWEMFRQEPNGDFTYVETGELPNTACLEFCRSKEYLTTGRCTWQRGWPK
ncbi:MAG TPA: hypothetical protein VJX71_13925 [Methylomirabilota bacterium]|nr:hypothetical protein [Methylomirabilota bacterium]